MEVHHLPEQSASKTLFSILNALYHKANPRPTAFVMFSDVMDAGVKSRGALLAIKIKELWPNASFYATGPSVNPKTGNDICVWIWTLDHDSLRKYYSDELMHRVEETN
jgi:hypothetical protein